MMNRHIYAACIVISVGCNNSGNTDYTKFQSDLGVQDSVRTSVLRVDETSPSSNRCYKSDTLNPAEVAFLTKLYLENEFIIISRQIERYYSKNDSLPLVNKIIYPEELLKEKGYVFFDLKFYGDIANMEITYHYSLGQGSFGFGTVGGNDQANYLHTISSCGVTACITQLYKDGQKVYEKVN